MSVALQHTERAPDVPEHKTYRPKNFRGRRRKNRRDDSRIEHSRPASPTFGASGEVGDVLDEEISNEDILGRRVDLDDLIGDLNDVLLQPPYDISPRAYLEINLVVGTILGEKYPGERTTGRIKADRIYNQLSDSAAAEIDPDEGGLGITNLANCPSTLVNQTEKYKKSAYKIGPKTERALGAFSYFNGPASQVAKATESLHRTGDVGPLKFLLSPPGTAPGTDAGADRPLK